MSHSNGGLEQYHRLEEFAETRFSELSKIFGEWVDVLVRYEELVCRAVFILGDHPPQDVADRGIRDLLADVFDFLYISRRLVLQGYASTALPLLRRAFESNSLIQYFMLLPGKAMSWNEGEQISNAEVRKYLDTHPMGQPEDGMRDSYRFFSGATHPNREYIPHRFLGEGNLFVLGAVAVPILTLVGDYVYRLIRLWFWLGALIAYQYREVLASADRTYMKDYIKLANEAQTAAEELLRRLREKWHQEYGKEAKHNPSSA